MNFSLQLSLYEDHVCSKATAFRPESDGGTPNIFPIPTPSPFLRCTILHQLANPYLMEDDVTSL